MSHRRNSQLAAEQYPQQDWSKLSAGVDVDVKYPDGEIDKAKIDGKSHDSRIVWSLTFGRGRKMYGDWEGVCLSPSARDHGVE